MAFTHTVASSWAGGGLSLSNSNAYSAASEVNFTETIAAVPDTQVNVAIDVSEVDSIYITCNEDITLETNAGGAPDNTINLVANVPYIWNTDSYDSFLLTVDVVAMFFTNASGNIATVQLRCIQDPTP